MVHPFSKRDAANNPCGEDFTIDRITGPIRFAGPTLKDRAHISADGSHRPVLEQALIEDLHAGETKILEMIARGNSLPKVLDALTQFIETHADGIHCSISFVDQNFVSAPRQPLLYRPSTTESWMECRFSRTSDPAAWRHI